MMLSAKYIGTMDGSAIARALGRRGGQARARRLSAEEKQRIAAQGGRARRSSLLAARRIIENLRYARAVEELRGAPRPVLREPVFAGRLPGLDLERS
jgi:hypothetical protein